MPIIGHPARSCSHSLSLSLLSPFLSLPLFLSLSLIPSHLAVFPCRFSRAIATRHSQDDNALTSKNGDSMRRFSTLRGLARCLQSSVNNLELSPFHGSVILYHERRDVKFLRTARCVRVSSPPFVRACNISRRSRISRILYFEQIEVSLQLKLQNSPQIDIVGYTAENNKREERSAHI